MLQPSFARQRFVETCPHVNKDLAKFPWIRGILGSPDGEELVYAVLICRVWRLAMEL
jgi:hypothetical protein